MSREALSTLDPVLESRNGGEIAIHDIAAEAEINLDMIKPEIVNRLILLHEKTQTLEDAHRAILLAKELFHFYELHKPRDVFSQEEQRIVTIGTFFTDIGKTGPLEADNKTRQCVAEIYGIEGNIDSSMRIDSFLKLHFSDDSEYRMGLLRSIGVRPATTMRAFWDLHSNWTYLIVVGGGVPIEAAAAAASHHLLEGINPLEIFTSSERKLSRYFKKEGFERAVKLIILLDKYDAARRRGKKTHSDAIAYACGAVYKNPYFKDDPVFQNLIEAIDKSLRSYGDTLYSS